MDYPGKLRGHLGVVTAQINAEGSGQGGWIEENNKESDWELRAGGRHMGFQGRRVGDHQVARITALLIGCKP